MTPKEQAQRLIMIFTEPSDNNAWKENQCARSRADTHCKLTLQLPYIMASGEIDYNTDYEHQWANYATYWQETMKEVKHK